VGSSSADRLPSQARQEAAAVTTPRCGLINRSPSVIESEAPQAAEVCVEEAACFLIEGFELSPTYVARLQASLAQAEVRGCFLGLFSPICG
jgi:hypothetical protein